MKFIVVLDHCANQEEIEAHGLSQAGWRIMMYDYLGGLMDPNITRVDKVFILDEIPTKPDPRVVY